MANYCESDLYVYGAEEDIRDFLAFAAGEAWGEPVAFDFGRFVPEPERTGDGKPVGRKQASESEWRAKKWGTGTKAFNQRVESGDQPERAVVYFTTPWSPPTPVVRAASKRFPSLRLSLEYYEAGAGVHGRYTCKGGKVLEDLAGPYYGARGG